MNYYLQHRTLLRVICIFFVLFLSKNVLDSQQTKDQLVLMCLAAHPDDEDGATLTYYSKLYGVKTYTIFFTRGEGGQNEIGSELYEDLGLIRTKETIEASGILGIESYFIGFPDFGFSKTAKETYAKWGSKDSVLARLVYYIRALKPDIIVTNHDTVTTKPYRQHGNHQAVGITAYEAFEKAADPTFHPEQLRGNITPWQVKKLFFRTSRQDSSVKYDPLTTIDVTQKDSSGTAIEEYAIASLNKHRSQGMEKLTLSTVSEWFHHRKYFLARSDKHYAFSQNNLFSGILPSARTIAVPNATPFDTSAQVRLHVSPGVMPLELQGEIGQQKIHRKFALTLLNRTSAPLDLTLKVTTSGTMLYSKRLYVKGEKLIDSVHLVLRKDKVPAAKKLKFEVISSSEHSRLSASADAELQPVSALVPHPVSIGLVKTYDTTLEDVLSSFNINFHLLDSAKLASENLSKYTTIVLDLRTYEFRHDARIYSSRLLEYVRNGGNVVCFYHKTGDWNGKEYAPYPITLTSERVTQEDAPVNILLPEHPLFTTPNIISPDDWNGWMQERSIYLPSDDTTKTPPNYQRLLGMSDEDEQQPPTSILSCTYGKGTYAYVSLVLYRQLRMLNPAAVKLLFNLISQPKH